MIERLMAHVIALPEAELATVLLEDMALCAACYDSLADMPERRKPYDRLRQVLDAWVRHALPPPTETVGKRQQPVLRKLINLIRENKWDEFTRADLDFLYFAAALSRRCSDRMLYDRPLACLQEVLEKVAEYRAKQERDPGLTDIQDRVNVVFEQDIATAINRDIRVFAGLDIPHRGPVLVQRGDTKVVGNVPEESILVVEEGDCYVQKMVLGRVAARQTCEVLGAVSGIIIARRGDIATGKIIHPATVIAKEGHVRCWTTERPKIVFAGRDLQIKTRAHLGKHMARCIQVDGEICGGEFHASESIKAPRFTQEEGARLTIILRRGLTCEDYGEVLNSEARILLLTAIKLRQQLDNFEFLQQLTERETDEYAGNVLLFVLGDDDASDRYQKVQKQRRRIAYMDRLLGGMQTLIFGAEDRVALLARANSSSDADQGEERDLLEEMQNELSSLASEGSMDGDLSEVRDSVLQIGRKLRRRNIAYRPLLAMVEQLSEERKNLQEIRDELARAVEEEENAIQDAVGRAALIKRAKEDCTRRDMLDQLLSAARQRPRSDLVNRRANDHYVRFMRRIIETRDSHVARYDMLIDQAERRIRDIRERLWEEYLVSLPRHIVIGWAGEGIRATGCFDEGIPLLAWPHMLEGYEAKQPGVCITESDPAQPITYVRSIAGHIEPR